MTNNQLRNQSDVWWSSMIDLTSLWWIKLYLFLCDIKIGGSGFNPSFPLPLSRSSLRWTLTVDWPTSSTRWSPGRTWPSAAPPALSSTPSWSATRARRPGVSWVRGGLCCHGNAKVRRIWSKQTWTLWKGQSRINRPEDSWPLTDLLWNF